MVHNLALLMLLVHLHQHTSNNQTDKLPCSNISSTLLRRSNATLLGAI